MSAWHKARAHAVQALKLIALYNAVVYKRRHNNKAAPSVPLGRGKHGANLADRHRDQPSVEQPEIFLHAGHFSHHHRVFVFTYFQFCQPRSRGRAKFRDAGKNRSGADTNAERRNRHLRLSHHLARTLPATFFHEKYTTPHVALARRSD